MRKTRNMKDEAVNLPICRNCANKCAWCCMECRGSGKWYASAEACPMRTHEEIESAYSAVWEGAGGGGR